MKTKGKSYFAWSFTYQETKDLPFSQEDSVNPSGKILGDEIDLERALLHIKVAKYVFQLEKGESGRYHYQGCLELKDRLNCNQLRKKLASLLRNNYSAGCLTLQPTHNREASEFYSMKIDTRVSGPWLFPLNGKIYTGSDLVGLNEFYPWQKTIMSFLMKDPDPRKVFLVNDHKGNSGKSTFAKYLCYYHKAFMVPAGLSSSQLIASLINAGPRKIYIIDLPRNTSKQELDRFIFSIESLKTGNLSSAYYGGAKTLLMDRPHVLITCNTLPDLRVLSYDMWSIYEIIPSDKRAQEQDLYALLLLQERARTAERKARSSELTP